MAKKRRTTRKLGWKETLVLLVLAAAVTFIRQALTPSYDMNSIPDYDGTSAYAVIDRNQPSFTEDDYTTDSYEYYSELDSTGPLRRCGGLHRRGFDAHGGAGEHQPACTPPAGCRTKYDFVDGKNLYNRCHLIGFQLTGENANEKNLITGTRYMNVEGMLPFENEVADYVACHRQPCALPGDAGLCQVPNWWPGAWRWRPTPWRTRAGACASMSTATTCSPAWRLTTPPGRTGRHDGAVEPL